MLSLTNYAITALKFNIFDFQIIKRNESMKNIKKISLNLITTILITSSLLGINPVNQTLKITNHTSVPLTLHITASCLDKNTGLILTDEKQIILESGEQDNFNYKVNKVIKGYSISYEGGLDSLQVSSGNTILETYTSQKNNKGLQYFPGLILPGSSYNLLNIYENTNDDSPISLVYDKLRLSLRVTQ